MGPGPPIVLFDGFCRLCNGSVNFILDHEEGQDLRFAPLQSELGQALMRRYGLAGRGITSVILINRGRVYLRSAAALRLAWRLRWPWRALAFAAVIPSPLRDLAYDWIARNRYRWFGGNAACRMPAPELAGRFLA